MTGGWQLNQSVQLCASALNLRSQSEIYSQAPQCQSKVGLLRLARNEGSCWRAGLKRLGRGIHEVSVKNESCFVGDVGDVGSAYQPYEKWLTLSSKGKATPQITPNLQAPCCTRK